LITRPEPGASETAARVAALGLRPVVAPVLEVRMLPIHLPAPVRLQAVLITSGNAIPALPENYYHLPLLAVGESTASRARAVGFTHVTSADGDASALFALAVRSCDSAALPLLLATGRGQGRGLAADLQVRGFRVMHRAVYAVEPVPVLPEAVCQALATGDVTAALFYSTETARHCVQLLQRAQLHEVVRPVEALAIGRPAAVALQALPWRRIRVAARPTQDAMLALLR
jgi:uroporphyrinogen-III synthase